MNIALFLSADGIALAHRQPAGHWAMIAEADLSGGDIGAALSTLREAAVEREGEEFEALLVLPDDQILYTSLTVPTADPELTVFRIEDGLDGLTPYSVTELQYDWRVLEEDRVKIAVVARETLDEARGFAAQYGFVGAGFAAMPPTERFPGVPLFELSDAAKGMDFSAEGIAFGPDTYGQPEAEAAEQVAPEPEEQSDAPDGGLNAEAPGVIPPAVETESLPDEVAPEDAAPEAEVEPAAPADAPGVVVPPVEEPSVEEPPLEPLPADEPSLSEEVSPDPVDAPEEPPFSAMEGENPALAEALNMAAAAESAPVQPIADPTQAGPIEPLRTEPEAETPPDPIGDAGDDDPALPPAPSPAAREARQRARVIRGEAPAAKPDSTAAPGGQFTARKSRVDSPAAPRGSLVGQREGRLGLTGASVSPAGDTPDTPEVTEGAAAQMPRLAEQLQRVRDASKTRPKPAKVADAPTRPRVEIDPTAGGNPTGLSASPRPSPFDTPPPAADTPDAAPKRGLLGGLRRSKPEDRKADAAALTAPAPSADVPLAAPTQPEARGGLLRRRQAAPVTDAPDATDGGDGAAVEDETFTSGLLARKATPSAGPSFRTGLILTVILLLLLAMVAIWSAVFLPDSPLARLLNGGASDDRVASAPVNGGQAPDVVTSAPVIGTAGGGQPSLADEAAADGVDLDLAALDPDGAAPPGGDTGAADDSALPDIDADLDLPPLPPIDPGLNPSVEEAEALYAEDGIWARSPERPDLRPFDLLDQTYTASIDPEVSAFDAVALPDPGVNPGELLRRFPPPPPFGTEFDLTADGQVAPTPEGVVTPEGAFVILGTPPVVASQRPREVVSEAPAIDVDDAVLAAFRPAARPADLSETRERQVLGGLTEEELSAVRPSARPQSPQEAAAAASLFPGDGPTNADDPDAVDPVIAALSQGTDLATARSLLPAQRPSNIAQIVASADRSPPEVTEVAAVAPSAVAPGPDIPSNADVSRAATERNAIRLRNVNLIGVTGTASDRRALVRLSSGRFVRVTVGDRLDGGRVAAIGETTLQYTRNGRTVTLEIPG
ncbi:hypothetical protein [Hasllibacter sp. MH4015]|uniref:hypothetical protein n=1 Tax=Hasllibacter sp. MH4015 TaxID=2854029 RepID=UPI001CD3D363|nr:hypothetical protein [Hasllibacter sp. MH4015]